MPVFVLSLPGCLEDAALGLVLLAGDALGVDAEEDVGAAASPFSDLGRVAGATRRAWLLKIALLMSLASVVGLGAAEPGLGLEGTAMVLPRTLKAGKP